MNMCVFRSITRSILHYGAIIYGSATDTNLKPLETITTEALRLAAGAFKTTPTNSLYILCNEMPSDMRRNYLSLVYYYKIRSQLSNPAFKHVVPIRYRLLFTNKHMTPHFPIHIQILIEKLNLRKKLIKPEFSYRFSYRFSYI